MCSLAISSFCLFAGEKIVVRLSPRRVIGVVTGGDHIHFLVKSQDEMAPMKEKQLTMF